MPEPTYRVEGLLPEEGISLWSGKPKIGKSVLLENLCVAVVEGDKFLGRQCYPCDVAFLTFEGSESVIRAQLKALGLQNTFGRLHTFHSPMLADMNRRWADHLRGTLDEHPDIKLVVIDPVAKLLQPRDNDDYGEVSALMAKLEAIARQRHVHFAVSVHEKKREGSDRGDAVLGSTGYRAASDVNMFLSRRGAQRQICTEQRWGAPIEEPVNLTFDPTTFRIGLPSTTT